MLIVIGMASDDDVDGHDDGNGKHSRSDGSAIYGRHPRRTVTSTAMATAGGESVMTGEQQ
jgi:hypothetical protein